VRVHTRQFVLGPEPVGVYDDWQYVELDDGLVLSHCPILPTARVRDAGGDEWCLLGLALPIHAGRPEPAQELRSLASGDPALLYRGWAGRWLLIGRSELHMDAAGTLGCFYRTVDGEVWVSSSPALIAELPGRRLAVEPPIRLAHAEGMDFFPPPCSGFRGVFRLLATQTLDVHGGRPSLRFRNPLGTVGVESDYAGGLERVQAMLEAAWAALGRRAEEICLTLTGGKDSRLLLAALVAAGVPTETVTLHHHTVHMAVGDRLLPARLAAAVGLEHRWVEPKRLSRGRLDAFDRHCARHSVDVERQEIAHGQWDWLPPGTLVVKGGVLDVVRQRTSPAHRSLYAAPDPASPAELAAVVSRAYRLDKIYTRSWAHREGIRRWAEWVWSSPLAGVDWRDRFDLEIRNGGWRSSVEQAFDLTGAQALHLATCGDLLAAMLALPADRRTADAPHHRDLVRRMAPVLDEFPMNPPDRGRARVRNRLVREWAMMRAAPNKIAYAAERARRLRNVYYTRRAPGP
jgi:hypothetical protein